MATQARQTLADMPAIPDHQGDLKPLEGMSKVELQDLLTRQEKILVNKRFVKSLKDGGKKIQTFADRLKQALKEREDIENTAQLFERLDLGAPPCMEGEVVERIPDMASICKDRVQADSSKSSPVEHSKTIPNVFLKTDNTTSVQVKKTQKFYAHKSLKSTTIPEGLTRPDVGPRGNASPARDSGEPRPIEYSAVVMPPSKHPGTKTIDLEESRRLLEAQKTKVDELVAQQSAERLAERLHIKLGEYTPSQIDMRYRNQEDEEDSDDDDDDDDGDDDDVDEDAEEAEND